MRQTLQIGTCLLVALSLRAQVVEIGQMDDVISEPSGINLLYNSSNGHLEYWVHNDYQNPETIYSVRLDDVSVIQREIDVGVTYIDWEDMAIDHDGNIYLGDFGNWVGPSDLQVVKIPDPNTYGGDPPAVEIITYVYPFAGVSDVEAMIHFEGHLYLFTKRVSENQNPSLDDTRTYCFRIPDTPAGGGGDHTAVLMGSMQVRLAGDPEPERVRVTGADLSPDGSKIALLCYERIWVLSCFQGDNFFGGTKSQQTIPFRQYEGISFANNHEVVISKEGNAQDPGFNPKLFYMDLHPWVDGSCIDCNKVLNGGFDDSTLGWSLFLAGAGQANLNISGSQAELDILTPSTSGWQINMRYKGLVLENGETYRVRFRAHADANRSMSVIANHASGTPQYHYQGIELTTMPVYYEFDFVMDQTTSFHSYLGFNVGKETPSVFIDDVQVSNVSCLCPNSRYFIADINNQVEHYEVSGTIFGQNNIVGNQIIYDAGSSICLDPGFEVSAGAVFEAKIDGCGGN